jgi:hypothetical protein
MDGIHINFIAVSEANESEILQMLLLLSRTLAEK